MNKKILVFGILAFAFSIALGLGGCKKDAPVDTPEAPEVEVTPEPVVTPEPAGEPEKTVEPEPAAPKTNESMAPDPEAVKNMLKDVKSENPELAELVAKMIAEAEKNRIVQTICPVMEAPINKNIFTEYQGKKVYFCCPECKEKFIADPQKYLPKLPQFKK